MPVPFGVGVGDFIAIVGLINNIKTALQDSGGARDDYQELERELELLELALGAIRSLTGPPHRQAEIIAIKLVALSCRRTLDTFYFNIKNYAKSLSISSRVSKIRASGKMMRWGMFMQGDVEKMRSYVSAHVGSLNTLISAEILKTSRESAEKAGEHYEYLKVAVEDGWKQSRTMILNVAEKADASQRVIQESFSTSHAALTRLEESVQISGDFVKGAAQSWSRWPRSLTATCFLLLALLFKQQMNCSHNEMIRILESRLPQPDSRFTWAQTPVYIEDALGRSIIVPSEYDYDMLKAVIVAKFKKGPGSEKVHSGDFELFDSFDSSHIVDADAVESTGLVPGMRITMAIIIGQYAVEKPTPRCANPGCKSQRFRAAEQGGQICLRCNTWFDRSSKALCRPLRPIEHAIERHNQTTNSTSTNSEIKPRYERKSFRNIRVYTTVLPSTRIMRKSRYGLPIHSQASEVQKQREEAYPPNFTYTDVPAAWFKTNVKPESRTVTDILSPAGDRDEFSTREEQRSVWRSMQQGTQNVKNLMIEKEAEKAENTRRGKLSFLDTLDLSESSSIDKTLENIDFRVDSLIPEMSETAESPERDGPTDHSWDGKYPASVLEKAIVDVEDLSEDEWRIVYSENRIQELGSLGAGGGGIVTKCILKGGQTIFALKSIRVHLDEDIREEIRRELKFNKMCDSEWVCKYYGYFWELNHGYSISMEYCEGGSLDDVYHEIKRLGGRIGEKPLGKVAEGVLSGLTYLHSLKIIHRDIKPANILFDKDGRVKICDFGVSGSFGTKGDARTYIGTSYYMSPERITGQSYTITADVWSLGVTLLEVAQQSFPLIPINLPPRAGLIDILTLIVRHSVPKLQDEPDNGIKWTEDFKHFIECCLEKDPVRRQAPWRMMEHPWMVSQRKKKVDMRRFLEQVWDWPKKEKEVVTETLTITT